MGKNLLVGVGGKARHVKALYVGVGGKARKVKEVYVGVGGKARLVWQDYVAVTGITLSLSKNTIYVQVTPSNATNKTIKWQIIEQDSPSEFKFIIYESDNNHCAVSIHMDQDQATFPAYPNAYVVVRATSADGPSKTIKVTLRDILS